MMIETSAGTSISSDVLHNYFRSLVNRFFKILPMREEGEDSLTEYMRSFQIELIGCKELISVLEGDASYLSLLSILQYLIDYPECTIHEVKREVFRAISLCNQLKAQFANERGAEK